MEWTSKECPVDSNADTELEECSDPNERGGTSRIVSQEYEEEWYEDEYTEEGSDSDDDDVPRRAFDVKGEPNYEIGPPADGEEYLRRVVAEAKTLPNVLVSDIDPRMYDSRRTVSIPSSTSADTSASFGRTDSCDAKLLEDFSRLRLQVAEMKARGQEACDSSPQKSSAKRWIDIAVDAPKLKELAIMENASICEIFVELGREVIQKERLTHQDSLWLFYVLALIEKPLDKDTESVLQSLHTHCLHLRSKLGEEDESVPHLNMIILISGKSFA